MDKESLIQAYLKGSLNKKQEYVFKKHLSDDSDFKAEFEYHKALHETLKLKEAKALKAQLNTIESRVRFGADRLVVSARFAGQRRTQTIPYKIVEADAHSLTIETKEGDQEHIHQLTFQADRVVVRFGSKATVLGPAKTSPKSI